MTIANINSDKALTGSEVGRLILEDLAEHYYQIAKGLNNTGLLSIKKKSELVNSLIEPDDIIQYNNYRYVHEYLARAAIDFTHQKKSAEAAFWKMLFILEALRRPNEELSSLRGLFSTKIKKAETPLFPDPLQQFNMDIFRSEVAEELFGLLDRWRYALREAMAIKTTIQLLAEYVQIPKVKYMASELDDLTSERICLMAETILNENQPPSPATDRLKVFADMAAQITPKSLKPSPAALRKARKVLSFKTVQGGISDFYSLILGEN